MKSDAPLLSIGSSGTFAGLITASRWKGRSYLRQRVIPANPKSPGQVSTRAMFRFLGQNWNNVSAVDQQLWLDLADIGKYSLINAFQSYNMDRWTQFTAPKVSPTEAVGTAPVMGALTLTAGVRQVSLSQVITTLNNIWGIIICRSATTGFTPAKSNVVAVAYGIASPIVFVDTPVSAGTWFYRTAGFNEGGTLSAFIAEQSVVVA